MMLTITSKIGVTTLQLTCERSIMKNDIFNRILNQIAQNFPTETPVSDLEDQYGREQITTAFRHLCYLGLVDAHLVQSMEGEYYIGDAKLAPKGISHFGFDSGLGADVNSVVIKIHEDTIKKLIELKILEADLEPNLKKAFLQELATAPVAAIKDMALHLMKKGLENPQHLIELFRSIGSM